MNAEKPVVKRGKIYWAGPHEYKRRLKDLSCGIEKNSIVLLEQIRTLDRSRLTE